MLDDRPLTVADREILKVQTRFAQACLLPVRIRSMKTGTPTREVTTPTGTMTPGTTSLLAIDAIDITNAPAKALAGRKYAMILSNEKACHVGTDKADEADGADEGDGGRGQDADAQERGEAQPVHVDPEGAGPVLAKAQRVQPQGRPGGEGRDKHQYKAQDRDAAPVCAREPAEHPEDELL